MFPSSGDAPGEDAPGLARFPGMRRVLSAREESSGQHPRNVRRAGAARGRAGVVPPHAPVAGLDPRGAPAGPAFPPEIEAHRATTAIFERGQTQLYLVFDEAQGTTSMMSLAGM